ncbi:hypothetical protein [Mucilaginibacter sp. UR6-11]|uniref:hypothetical protein n=1 Tax=Mucilaginibacter sp. UR6-11 TaxID=1435644 RepID=UPI001E29CB2E|nr:hypothetical protein [Mucilaginibacter sp. UR6-11]MCC8427249.1 hypothetical protein [Mucilaginibacter sp. UR6-11]
MKIKPAYLTPVILFTIATLVSACKDIMEPSLSKRIIVAKAPGNQYQSPSYTVNFWWDELEDALTYRLQVVTPNFNNIAGLVLDTIVKSNKFTFNLKPGNYEWHVLAQNGSSQTPYSFPKGFTVLTTSITSQSVQLTSPANNFLTNQPAIILQWGNLYGATKYHLEIDTNNFINENALVYDQSIPGQQVNFNFPKDQIYQWRVRAENDTAKAQWSSINSITSDHTPPTQVVSIGPGNNQQISLPAALQWNSVPSASKYKLYAYKSDSTTTYNSNFPILLSTTSYSFNWGAIGERVYWKVTAIDAAGNEGQASVLKSFVLK